jgi:hypothetical protein
MRLDTIISSAAGNLVWPLLRRAVIALTVGIFAGVAVYHLTIAGNIALAGQYGDFDARLIIGGIYAALALVSLFIFWSLRSKTLKTESAPALANPREMQLVMLVEAVMLGYALARKRSRAS